MHSAFLRTDEGWKSVVNFQEVLDHDGEIRVNENEADRDVNLALIGAEAGKHAFAYNIGNVLLTRSPIRNDTYEAIADIDTFGEGCVWCVYDFANVDGVYIAEGQNSTVESVRKRFEKCRGVVAVKERLTNGSELYVFTRNEQLWSKCMEKYKTKKRKEELKETLNRPCKYEFDKLIYKIADKCNCRSPSALTLDQLWIWVVAHDAAFGKRETNKLVRNIALKWCNDREKSRKWMSRWSGKDITARLDRRLADSLRLGDKNSRHKPKQKKKPGLISQAA